MVIVYITSDDEESYVKIDEPCLIPVSNDAEAREFIDTHEFFTNLAHQSFDDRFGAIHECYKSNAILSFLGSGWSLESGVYVNGGVSIEPTESGYLVSGRHRCFTLEEAKVVANTACADCR